MLQSQPKSFEKEYVEVFFEIGVGSNSYYGGNISRFWKLSSDDSRPSTIRFGNKSDNKE